MDEFPTFRLFADPVGEGVFARTVEVCTLCGETRGWKYVLDEYGIPEPDRECLCPWCIADGTAAAKGMKFNMPILRPEMRLRAEPNADDIAAAAIFGAKPKPGLEPVGPAPGLPPDDAAEVEGRTPGFTTWQGQPWQMCCGRACRYLGAAGKPELTGKWAQAAEVMRDREIRQGRTAESFDYFLDRMKRGDDPQAYVFQCVICGKLCGDWDMS